MCQNCRAFITTADRVCPYCNERVAPKAIELRNTGEMIAGLIPHARFVTTLLLIVNGGLFLACYAYPGGPDNPQVLYAFGAKYGGAILQEHQWWRLITAGFLHGGLIHILMNGWVLLDLGAQIEVVYGPARLIVFYVVSSVAGFLLSLWWAPGILSIGASAALFGFIGAMIAFGIVNTSSIGREIRKLYVRWAIYGLIYSLIPMFHIDVAAHIGGLAAGLGLGYVAGNPVHSTYARERLWQILAGICVLLTLVSFYLVYLHFPRLTQ